MGIIITGRVLERNIKDFFELVVGLIFLFYYFTLIHQSKKSDTLRLIFKQIARFIGMSSIVVALIGLVKFMLQLKGIVLPVDTPFGTSINSDKNFYSLYSFLGIISYIPLLIKKQSMSKSLFIQLIIGTLLINILFSFSYRGIIILVLLLVGLIITNIITLINSKQAKIKNIRNNSLMLLFGVVLFGIVINSLNENKIVHQVTHHVNVYLNNTQELTSNAFHFNKWEYAIEYYQQQPFINKVFGSGFSYLQAFGQEFNENKELVDYPHNPIISALLYSGIVGAVFALLFLIISVYYGILYFKKYTLFSLMLFTSLLFVFFSGNSLFSVPIFLFLFSLSFLIRHQEITELHIDFNLDKPGSRFVKEATDYIIATIVFIVLLPFLLLTSLFIGILNGWPIIYSQSRVGQNGKVFELHKFRTMAKVISNTSVASAEFHRISKFGKILRRTKIDELPELWNIIRGDMSFVGPRPDVSGYADMLIGDDKEILSLKPGLTGVATLKYANEEELLLNQDNPQQHNDEVIFPDKVRINRAYMKYWSFWLDIKIIIFTVLRKPLKEECFQ